MARMGSLSARQIAQREARFYRDKKVREEQARKIDELFTPEFRAARKAYKQWAVKSTSDGLNAAEPEIETVEERKKKMTIVDIERFRTEIYEPLCEKTQASSRAMAGLHKGLANSARELSDGYAVGMTLDQIQQELNSKRIACQKDYYATKVDASEKVEAFLTDTFRLVPSELEEVSSLMDHVSLTPDELRGIVRENVGSYTVLRAVEKYANERGMGYGLKLTEALNAYREGVEKHCRGVVDTCARGVLDERYHEQWAGFASSRFDSLAGADESLACDLGAVVAAPNAMQQMVSEYAWIS